MKTKNCPFCGEEILETAKKCKHCGEWLNDNNESAAEVHAAPKKVVEQSVETPNGTPGFFEYYLEDVWAPGRESKDGPAYYPRFDFKGVLPRKRFWISSILIGVVYGTLSSLFFTMAAFGMSGGGMSFWQIIGTILMLATLPLFFVKCIEMQIRRLRDIGKSGWLLLLHLVPFFGALVLMVLFLFKGSDTGVTKWNKKDFVELVSIAVLVICCMIISQILL